MSASGSDHAGRLRKLCSVVLLTVAAACVPTLGAHPADAAPATSTTWTAPWQVQASCGATACSTATGAGDLRAIAYPVVASTTWYGGPYQSRSAVIFTDTVTTRATSRTYTATVELHDATTSGAGYAYLSPWLDEAPGGSCWGCTIGGGLVVATGDTHIANDRTLTVTIKLGVSPDSTLKALPTGTYRISFGVTAGIAANSGEASVMVPWPCMSDSCYSTKTVYYGVGSADIAATVQQITT